MQEATNTITAKPEGRNQSRWTIIGRATPRRGRRGLVHARCACGNERVMSAYAIRAGFSLSCGCLHREVVRALSTTHGMGRRSDRDGTYRSWDSMKQRCRNPGHHKFPSYGGRGINVCERWLSYENFFADMGKRPPGTTLGRKDNDGNYTPENCAWQTSREQSGNKRNSNLLTHNGTTKCLAEFAKEFGKHPNTVRMRLSLGWTTADALTKPVGKCWRHAA